METAPIPDTTPPDTTITGKPAEPTNDPDPTFEFAATEPASFECRADSGLFASCSSPHTFGPFDDGSHIFEVRAADGAGNADPTPASQSFTVDTV